MRSRDKQWGVITYACPSLSQIILGNRTPDVINISTLWEVRFILLKSSQFIQQKSSRSELLRQQISDFAKHLLDSFNLSCGDTSKTWMWYLIGNQSFDNEENEIENSSREEIGLETQVHREVILLHQNANGIRYTMLTIISWHSPKQWLM